MDKKIKKRKEYFGIKLGAVCLLIFSAVVLASTAVNAGCLGLTKTADPDTIHIGESEVTYTYTMTNNCGGTMTDISLTDDPAPDSGITCSWPGGPSLERLLFDGETATCTATTTLTGGYAGQTINNTANAIGHVELLGGWVDATADATVTVKGGCVFLIIDEDSIDNGNPPNFFSDVEVNDQIADIGLREPLPAFAGDNVGKEITLFTGEVGDEGWFAPKVIPAEWDAAGPTGDGLQNYVLAGPGLGTPDADGDREALLDKIPDVTPLRATGLKMLEGQTICAVVYDSDVSINYDPLDGSLKGDNLGIVAFEVLNVEQLFGYSSSSLPKVEIKILNADTVFGGEMTLFTDAPEPTTSSEPFDITPPTDTGDGTSQQPEEQICWSADHNYLKRGSSQLKKFCKCAEGNYGYYGYSYAGWGPAYRYMDNGDNENWETKSITRDVRRVSSVRCTDGEWYDTDQDYYYG